ncbi:DUF742 domain-containing protein [Actinomadura geliboluensis]|uniref:DUF742 domain-containing protein n=1 Tax=Actinomadura geliboluensis TaxID=882440 RepID=A0A5S4HGS5_9ACTN|nr:DUF742 domain-containing protein [Actinomadura geliboluensis]TMR38180.1 DUF742 domain-containing protein [Actinomadura geliboluensis]
MSSDPRSALQPGAQGSAPSGPWVDQDVQQVRPYVVADVRAVSRYEMRLDTVLTTATTTTAATGVAATRTGQTDALLPEAARAIGLCEAGGCSVAEIAATIRQPVLVAMTLLEELLDAGALVIAPPAAPHGSGTGRPSPHLLQALLEGLEAHDFAVA